jgi:hypothetical protein
LLLLTNQKELAVCFEKYLESWNKQIGNRPALEWNNYEVIRRDHQLLLKSNSQVSLHLAKVLDKPFNQKKERCYPN